MGNLLTKDETEAQTTYQYDNLYRLTQTAFAPKTGSGLEGTGYTQQNSYDALGNIISKDVDTGNANSGNRNYQYSSGKPHAVSSFTGNYQGDTGAAYTFTYDLNGNMTNENIAYSGSQTNTKSFSWNGENQLTTLSWNGTNWNYYYDSTGERIKKVKNEGQSGEDTTTYINGMEQVRAGSTVYAVFDGVNRIAAINEVSGVDTTFYLNTDHVGSTSLVTRDDGTAYQQIVYKSFGDIYKIWKDNVWSSPSAGDLANIGSYAFTGQELDGETGLYYYGARYYDANIGRFISADSHVDGKGLDTQGYNRYTYVRNNPVIYSDPSGHDFWSWIDGIGASIQSAIDNNRVLATIVGAVMMVTGAVLCAVGLAPLGTVLLTGGYSVMSRAINGFGNLSASASLTFDTPGVGNGDNNNNNGKNNKNNGSDKNNTDTSNPPPDTQNHGQTDDGLTVDQYADRAQESNDAMNDIAHAQVDLTHAPDPNNLIKQQNRVINDPNYQQNGNTTFCNYSTYDVILSTGGEASLDRFLGSDASVYMSITASKAAIDLKDNAATGKIQEINGVRAQQLSNQGYTVVVSMYRPGDSHLSTVRPYDGPYVSTEGPKIANVGTSTWMGIQSAANGFGHNNMNIVHYYYDPNQIFILGN
jgi:RHS repeat-associated protein